MKCKARWCDLESGHVGKCRRVVNAESVVNSASNIVVNELAEGGPGKRALRQTVWQQKNRERYNEKMREYMRKRRAAG